MVKQRVTVADGAQHGAGGQNLFVQVAQTDDDDKCVRLTLCDKITPFF